MEGCSAVLCVLVGRCVACLSQAAHCATRSERAGSAHTQHSTQQREQHTTAMHNDRIILRAVAVTSCGLQSRPLPGCVRVAAAARVVQSLSLCAACACVCRRLSCPR